MITIIGVPIACKDGIKDSWREVADWAAGQLKARFGETLEVSYYNLLDADCPSIPQGAQLPLVLANGEVISSGGKISVPAIRKYLEASGLNSLTPGGG
jgi:hypothetical protein